MRDPGHIFGFQKDASSGQLTINPTEVASVPAFDYKVLVLHDFTPAHMTGRIYVRYFPENDISIFLYIVSSDSKVLQNCDEHILKYTNISAK